MVPTLEIHPHQEFHFAENTDSKGCCCFWKSKTKPKEYFITEDGVLKPYLGKKKVEDRIISNERLTTIVKSKFQEIDIDNDVAFEILKKKINYNFSTDKITKQRLIDIITAVFEIKEEIPEYDVSK